MRGREVISWPIGWLGVGIVIVGSLLVDFATWVRGAQPRCQHCECSPVYDDELCRDCFEEINGQFGVGA